MEITHINILKDNPQLNIPLELTREPPRHDLFFESDTRHEAVVPYGKEYTKLNKEPKCNAKKFKFNLDFFQKISISAIERDESVMVSAHTSSGKTVVAEYAIAHSIKNKHRVIYTSPIKALSNQKYREFREEFQDVGLITGDVTINPTANCLIMTIEIFRNILYKNPEIITDIHWVIFDEIHYMKDRERGVVWEETLILLPKHIRMVFLSATIPNALEFAEWICYISGNPLHVVYTENRVIPLHHYFCSTKKWLIKDDTFRHKTFEHAIKTPIWRNLLNTYLNGVIENINLPALIFSFSRKDCEKYANGIINDFNTSEDKKLVQTIFKKSMKSLAKKDRNLLLIKKMLPLMERGIGIHHSGLLPIIKEIVEILFQKSLIKVLFATETFSLGLNIPVKSVVFTSLKKFDGISKRTITNAEYTQMSGRAGRRGLDKQGIVISMISENISPYYLEKLFLPSEDNLNSAFRLTYNMILNLTRIKGLGTTYMLSKSFFHFQAYKNTLKEENKLINEISETKTKIQIINQIINIKHEKSVTNDIKLITNQDIEVTKLENNNIHCKSKEIYELLNKYVMTCKKRNKEIGQNNIDKLNKTLVIDIMIPRRGNPLLIKNMILKNCYNGVLKGWVLTNENVSYLEFPVDYISAIYNAKSKMNSKVFDMKFPLLEYEDKYAEEIKKIKNQLHELVPTINLENCLFCGQTSRIYHAYITHVSRMYHACITHVSRICLLRCSESPTSDVNLNNALEAIKADIKMDKLREKITNFKKLKEIYHLEEYKKMIVVLTKLGYLNETSILIKGKIASEITTSNELVLTEMIVSSDFTKLSISDMIALLSCFVCEEKFNPNFILSLENRRLFDILRISQRIVLKTMEEAGINVDHDLYFDSFSYQMMDIVKMWITGYPFSKICRRTSIFEGTIIRTLKRLEELLRQLINAANTVGNNELVDIFVQANCLIRRDIVFANSLYF